VKKLVSVFLMAVALGAMAGCASRAVGEGDRPAITGGSGVTVFGTIDAGVSKTRSR
jgi:hypothetical protein